MNWLPPILYFILGSCGGSFVNAWVWRTRENLAIVASSSICPHCRSRIWRRDNIPILGFLFLAGRCRQCRGAISYQYPLVELCAGALFVLAAYAQGQNIANIELARDWILIVFLMTVFIYDLRCGEILDQTTTVPALILAGVSVIVGWQTWQSLVLGILVGGGIFFLLYFFSSGAWIGGGDVRLGFFVGVILGWPGIVLALLLSYIMGAIGSIVLILLKRKKFHSSTPFGTYLSIGTLVSMFWGNTIIVWYLGLM